MKVELLFAEREGFKPPVPCSTAVFKTAAIDHSAISPVIHPFFKGGAKIRLFLKLPNRKTVFDLLF